MDEQNLNPRGREWPDSDPQYGEVVEEQFFERESGPKRVASVQLEGAHFLILQDCYVEQGEVGFGPAAWLKIDDGTAALGLQLAHQMLFGMLQKDLNKNREAGA
jgi:hypothetical protein